MHINIDCEQAKSQPSPSLNQAVTDSIPDFRANHNEVFSAGFDENFPLLRSAILTFFSIIQGTDQHVLAWPPRIGFPSQFGCANPILLLRVFACCLEEDGVCWHDSLALD